MWDFFVLEFLRKGIALKFLWVSCVQHIVEKGGRCKVFCGISQKNVVSPQKHLHLECDLTGASFYNSLLLNCLRVCRKEFAKPT